MNSYRVTSMEWGQGTEQWFSTKKEAIRFAKGITRRGFEPTVMEYRNDAPSGVMSNGRKVGQLSVLNSLFWRGW